MPAISNATNSPAAFNAVLSNNPAAYRVYHRMPVPHDVVHFDALGAVRLDKAYSDCREKIGAVLQLIGATGTGRALLADLKAFTEQRGGFAIGPRGAFDHQDIEDFGGLVQRGHDDEVVWDFKEDAHELINDVCGHAAYTSLVKGLVAARNYAAHRLEAGIPMLKVEDVQHAFLAELAVRAIPAVDPARAGGAFLDRVGYDVAVTPAWRDPVFFDALDGVMPAWLTPEARKQRDDVRELLLAIARTDIGTRVLQDLRVYGRSGGAVLIHPSRHDGAHGVYRHGERGVIWLFDRSVLAALAISDGSDGLSSCDRRASGALRCLLRAREMLAERLGMMSQEVDIPATQELFEKQTLERAGQFWPSRSRVQAPLFMGQSPARVQPQARADGAAVPHDPHPGAASGSVASRNHGAMQAASMPSRTDRTERSGFANRFTQVLRDARMFAAALTTSHPPARAAANAPHARPNEYSSAPEARRNR